MSARQARAARRRKLPKFVTLFVHGGGMFRAGMPIALSAPGEVPLFGHVVHADEHTMLVLING